MKYLSLVLALAAGAVTAMPRESGAQAPASIKIGYAVSKTGPYAGGAGITTIPNYQVWVKDVNDAGGIMLSSIGKRVPIEAIEYDDRSNSEEAVKAIERLANQDKADFILAPWGTALNLAVGPIFQPAGLSAPCGDRGHRPRAGTCQALGERFVLARHVGADLDRAGRNADQAAQRRKDRG